MWGTIQRRSSSSLFLQQALVTSSDISRNVHSLMLSTQHLCRPRPHSRVLWRVVFERLLWRVACPNHASFRLSTVARRGFCGPTRKLTTQVIIAKIQFATKFDEQVFKTKVQAGPNYCKLLSAPVRAHFLLGIWMFGYSVRYPTEDARSWESMVFQVSK